MFFCVKEENAALSKIKCCVKTKKKKLSGLLFVFDPFWIDLLFPIFTRTGFSVDIRLLEPIFGNLQIP